MLSIVTANIFFIETRNKLETAILSGFTTINLGKLSTGLSSPQKSDTNAFCLLHSKDVPWRKLRRTEMCENNLSGATGDWLVVVCFHTAVSDCKD